MKGTRFIGIGSRFVQWLERYYDTDVPGDELVYINDADVTFELRDASDAPVPGGSGTMAYVPGTNGTYRGIIPATVTNTLTENAKYTIAIVASVAGEVRYRAYAQFIARVNRGARNCWGEIC